MSKYCPNPPRVFAAQVIQEDEETPQTPDNNESHDAHEIHDHKSNGREETPIPEETKEAPEHSVDPNRSQYDSGNDEFPLDTFDEYIKVEESYGDSDIVYICAAREMSPSPMKDLISLADTSGVREDPTTTEAEVVSTVNPVVPRDLSPQELLVILPEDKCLKVYYQRKEEEDPNWVPQYVGFPTQRYWPRAPDRLLSLGYSWDDEINDSNYIERVAQTDPEGFENLTGYRVPSHVDHVTCRTCGECTPEVCELIFMDNDGTMYMHTIYNCQNSRCGINNLFWINRISQAGWSST